MLLLGLGGKREREMKRRDEKKESVKKGNGNTSDVRVHVSTYTTLPVRRKWLGVGGEMGGGRLAKINGKKDTHHWWHVHNQVRGDRTRRRRPEIESRKLQSVGAKQERGGGWTAEGGGAAVKSRVNWGWRMRS